MGGNLVRELRQALYPGDHRRLLQELHRQAHRAQHPSPFARFLAMVSHSFRNVRPYHTWLGIATANGENYHFRHIFFYFPRRAFSLVTHRRLLQELHRQAHRAQHRQNQTQQAHHTGYPEVLQQSQDQGPSQTL